MARGGGYGRRGHYGYPRYRRRGGGSCLRDLFFLDVGCCLADALGDNCLLLMMSAALQQATGRLTGRAPAPRTRAAPPGAGRVAGRLLAAVRFYQREVSPPRRPCCRFTPSCSEYAAQALSRHGAVRGSWLAGRRLLRCRPGARRGADPVPVPTR